MTKIEVEYNEFSNWEQEVKVKHPECEHEEYENLLRGDSEVSGAFYCLVCKSIGRLERDEDGYSMDWSCAA